LYAALLVRPVNLYDVVLADTFLMDFQLPFEAVIWYPLILNLDELSDFAHFSVTALSDPTAEKLFTLAREEFTVAALVTDVRPRKPRHKAATVIKRR
jgi:hypothetical protein